MFWINDAYFASVEITCISSLFYPQVKSPWTRLQYQEVIKGIKIVLIEWPLILILYSSFGCNTHLIEVLEIVVITSYVIEPSVITATFTSMIIKTARNWTKSCFYRDIARNNLNWNRLSKTLFRIHWEWNDIENYCRISRAYWDLLRRREIEEHLLVWCV